MQQSCTPSLIILLFNTHFFYCRILAPREFNILLNYRWICRYSSYFWVSSRGLLIYSRAASWVRLATSLHSEMHCDPSSHYLTRSFTTQRHSQHQQPDNNHLWILLISLFQVSRHRLLLRMPHQSVLLLGVTPAVCNVTTAAQVAVETVRRVRREWVVIGQWPSCPMRNARDEWKKWKMDSSAHVRLWPRWRRVFASLRKRIVTCALLLGLTENLAVVVVVFCNLFLASYLTSNPSRLPVIKLLVVNLLRRISCSLSAFQMPLFAKVSWIGSARAKLDESFLYDWSYTWWSEPIDFIGRSLHNKEDSHQ